MQITIYFPYYNQNKYLITNLEHYSKFDRKLREKFTIFIVDDGSSENCIQHC